MTLIEGVGDEVTHFVIGVLLVLIGVFAWYSTRIAEPPLVRTVFVFERRSRNRRLEQRNHPTATVRPTDSTSTQRQMEAPTVEDKPPEAGTSDNGNDPSARPLTPEEQEQNAIVETMDSDIGSRQQPEQVYSVQSVNTETTVSESAHSETEPEESIRIKLKYINDDLKLVDGKLTEKLGDFKQRHFQGELATNKLVRLIFNGQVLQRDTETLQGYGLFDNCVVHCLVHQRRPNITEQGAHPENNVGVGQDQLRGEASPPAGANGRECDLGSLVFTLITFILCAAWYFRYEYGQLYTLTATVALGGLTAVFTVLLIGLYLPEPDPVPPAPRVRS